MIVVDTSAIVNALVARPAPERLVDRLADAGSLHAPHLLDVEVTAALRGLVLGGRLAADRASDALTDYLRLPIVRYSVEPLLPQVWALRDRLTAYDATFVALAQALGRPLVTCDRKVPALPGLQVEEY